MIRARPTRVGLLALGAGLTIGLAIGAAVAVAQPARGIDHAAHQRAAAAAKKPVTCTDCHAMSAAGTLATSIDHSWCFGTCHEAPAKFVRRKPYVIAPGARRLCETCHPRDALDKSGDGDRAAFEIRVPPAGPTEFAVTLSHQAHGSAPCASCHAFAPRPPRPHTRCVRCHQRKPVSETVPMSACTTCHREGETEAVPSPFGVGAQFSHRRHTPRVRAAQGTCETCHPGAAAATIMGLATPSKSTCTDCHKTGGAAFTTQTDCRRCHATPKTLADRVRAPSVVLTHTSHADVACSSCHDASGRFTPQKGHALCSQGSCHPDELSSRTPVICSSCHVGSEPWLPQHVDPPSRPASDFGTRFAHQKHEVASCETCHQGDPRDADAGLTRGHASCAGAACHDAGASPPSMTECDRCHVADARATRRALADRRVWSVRKSFDHRRHRTALDGSQLVCDVCHEVAGAPSADRDLPPPPKRACVGCHDGSSAFKVTGHDCRRCHVR